MTRIGVLGGTFDPPHYGHLILAEQAREQLELSRVLWVPAADPPHKHGRPITPVEHRLEMVRLALVDNPAFEISLVDVNRPGPHYTHEMLALLAGEHPNADLVFLIGEDSLRDLPTWREPSRLIQYATLGVMRRQGITYEMEALEAAIPGLRERVTFLDTPLIDIAAADLRARVAAGRTIRYFLPPGVRAYIHQHSLYQV
ncbi:MAG TPA: nicotinate-nucleotide adenylyltransferase [Chloroflexi bacterium]|nr:nicotinate-nucleotide adenylyltransferase [Chloroflexota bacterium]